MADSRRENYSRKSEVSVWNWILSLILLIIPLVNLIMIIVWAVSCKRPSKRNYAIASLILIILLIVAIIVGIAFYGQQISEACQWLREWVDKMLPAATTVEPIAAMTPAPTMLPEVTVAPLG